MSLDATVGGANSNSYVTVAEATAYFRDRAYSQGWDDYENKAQILILSSRMLDWYIKWKGNKASPSQAMEWPRSGVVRPDGSPVDSTIIPKEVKYAVYELALSSLTEDRLADNPLDGLVQIQASSLMLKTDNPSINSTKKKPIPDKIYKILSDFTVKGGYVVRLVRA